MTTNLKIVNANDMSHPLSLELTFNNGFTGNVDFSNKINIIGENDFDDFLILEDGILFWLKSQYCVSAEDLYKSATDLRMTDPSLSIKTAFCDAVDKGDLMIFKSALCHFLDECEIKSVVPAKYDDRGDPTLSEIFYLINEITLPSLER